MALMENERLKGVASFLKGLPGVEGARPSRHYLTHVQRSVAMPCGGL